jgi:alpha-amylase
MHQPQRLNPYSALDIGRHLPYFNHRLNRELLHQVADNTYLPVVRMLLDLVKEHEGDFKLALSISGTLLEQIEYQRPDLLRILQKLAETGQVEFLAETYYHSLSFLYSREEFFRQVILHKEKIWLHFQQDPVVFHNTELVYHNQLAYFVRQMGFRGVLAEGLAEILKGRNPNLAFRPPDLLNIQVLLRNSELSTDLSTRFDEIPAVEGSKARGFAQKLHQQSGDRINLSLPMEDLGKHLNGENGKREFMRELPAAIRKEKNWSFATPSELVQTETPPEVYDVSRFVSKEDKGGDMSAWRGNALQEEALQKVYELELVVRNTQNKEIMKDWSLLQASDHFFFMDIKEENEEWQQESSRPYANAYDAYLAFMNVLADFQLKLRNAGRG